MVKAILNKSWKQHSTNQQLYSNLPPISKNVQVRWTRYCYRSKNEPISDVLLWTPLHGQSSVGQPIRTYLPQLCTDTGYSLEDLLEVMDDRDEWGGSQGNPCEQHDIMMLMMIFLMFM